jgi:hypothetical protein
LKERDDFAVGKIMEKNLLLNMLWGFYWIQVTGSSVLVDMIINFRIP